MTDTPRPPVPFSQRLTPDIRRAWAAYEAANREAAEEYRELPTTDKRAIVELAMQDASEGSRDGTFTAADIHKRTPDYITLHDVTLRAQIMCSHQILGVARAARNGANRYGFRKQP